YAGNKRAILAREEEAANGPGNIVQATAKKGDAGGQLPSTINTLLPAAASRAAGVMMARAAIRMVRPSRSARRTSSSETKSTAGGGDVGLAAPASVGEEAGGGGAPGEPSRCSTKAATWSRR